MLACACLSFWPACFNLRQAGTNVGLRVQGCSGESANGRALATLRRDRPGRPLAPCRASCGSQPDPLRPPRTPLCGGSRPSGLDRSRRSAGAGAVCTLGLASNCSAPIALYPRNRHLGAYGQGSPCREFPKKSPVTFDWQLLCRRRRENARIFDLGGIAGAAGPTNRSIEGNNACRFSSATTMSTRPSRC
jgi:hypothetical protein